jgi:hypothetical protein
MSRMNRILLVLLAALAAAGVSAQTADSSAVQTAVKPESGLNALTIENETDVFTAVRIRVLPADTVAAALEIPAGEKRTVRLPDGKYVELIRFGSDSTEYRYGKGEGFELSSPGPNQWIEASLTLDGLEEGNYRQDDVTAEEFDKTGRTGP